MRIGCSGFWHVTHPRILLGISRIIALMLHGVVGSVGQDRDTYSVGLSQAMFGSEYIRIMLPCYGLSDVFLLLGQLSSSHLIYRRKSLSLSLSDFSFQRMRSLVIDSHYIIKKSNSCCFLNLEDFINHFDPGKISIQRPGQLESSAHRISQFSLVIRYTIVKRHVA